jgi:hypothetical protein
MDSSIVDFELLSNNMIFFDKGLNRYEPSNISGEGVKKLFGINCFYLYNAKRNCAY